jgi:hypothetical protein
MRALHVLLIFSLGMGSVVQAYARTLSEAHCRGQGHISLTAVDAAHDEQHSAHHGDEEPSSSTTDTGSSHGEQCQCGCLCAQAGAIPAAIAPTFYCTDAPLPEHFAPANDAAPAHAEHSAPQRPPAVLS